MVQGLQGYLKQGFKLIDTTTYHLANAGSKAAPVGALGGLCGCTVAFILGGHVVATGVGCATVVFAAIAINELVKSIVTKGYWRLGDHRLSKHVVISSAMLVTFALPNLSHFKSIMALSVLTTFAVSLAYHKLRARAEKGEIEDDWNDNCKEGDKYGEKTFDKKNDFDCKKNSESDLG